MTKKQIINFIENNYPDSEILLADGFENAFVVIAERCGSPPFATYSYEKCIEILQRRDGMSYEDAVDCFCFNTAQAYVGEATPAFLLRP